jgi:putative FmdB family regulatory protein
MPIFEYACEPCQHKFELLVRNGSTEIKCPKCGGDKHLRKLFSVFAAHSGGTASSSESFAEGGFDGPGCGRCGDPNGPCGM